MMRVMMIRLCLLMLMTGVWINLHGQNTKQPDYYVVIGTCSTLLEAEKLTDAANLKGFSAQYALHENKDYYVFLLQTSDKKRATEFKKQIRKETEFKNAWIYKGILGK